MRPCSTALAAYLAANDTFVIADLYTFALATGEVLRYSGWITPLAIPGIAFPAGSLNYKPYSSDPRAPAMPDQFAEDLVRVGNDIRTQEQNLSEKHSEESTMSKQFESDIARFKELKAIH